MVSPSDAWREDDVDPSYINIFQERIVTQVYFTGVPPSEYCNKPLIWQRTFGTVY